MAQEQELLKRFFVAVSAAVLLMTKLMADNVDELGEFELVLNCLIVIAILESRERSQLSRIMVSLKIGFDKERED